VNDDEIRAGTFARWFDERVGARALPWRWGSLIVHPGFPRSTEVNFVRLEDPAAADDAAMVPVEVGRTCEVARTLPLRVVVEDAQLAHRLTPAFERCGWRADRYVLMVHRRSVARCGDEPPVAEVSLDRFLAFRESLAAELAEPPSIDRAFAEAVDRTIGTRCFLRTVGDAPVSGCLVWRHGEDAQLDTVETLPSARGLGAASSVVDAAVRAAADSGAMWIHLHTHEATGPVRLYERLGFVTAGETVEFTR
jgi:GNAT superfamily N-acetyltransferase